MKIIVSLPQEKQIRVFGWIAACAVAFTTLAAQGQAPRIAAEISSSETMPLKGSLHPLARPEFDAGRVPAETKLTGMSIVFKRSAAQEADLKALMAAQQNPASPLFHKWLTPEQFGARFGMAPADLDAVTKWLEQQGFAIDSVARSRDSIHFSGTVSQAERAFQTEMHYYTVGSEQHFAPSTELQLPSALAPSVLAVENLSNFRPKSHAVVRRKASARPGFTSGQSGDVYFAPGDIATVYDITSLYGSGYTGTGQSIAIVGQSAVQLSDIENFQSAAGLAVKDPTLDLVPNTGSSTINPYGNGDELESDLDLEWSGAIAKGANIIFVYTGNSNNNQGTFQALQYAIDEDLAPVISISYGTCEPELGSFSLESSFEKAATQGQTILASAGDDGSTSCFISTPVAKGDPSQTVQESLAVEYPASSPNVTGVGGTEVSQANADYLTSDTAYWAAASGSDVLSSALQYLPEVVWNDDLANCGETNCLSAGGGGISTLFAQPTWQTGVPGIPSGSMRDVPDVALYASPNYPGYLFCSSDPKANINGSCASGFRDTSDTYLTIGGGTSFAAPIFAGMVAILNQEAGYSTGQGLINPGLYSLAGNSTTYAAAFNDVTSGSNACSAGSNYCSSAGETGYSAGTGYDLATGLGSVNLGALASAWAANTGATPIDTSTTVAASNPSPLVNVADNFTISVASTTGSTIPSGTVTVTVDGGTPVTGLPLTVVGNAAVATYSATFATFGTHTVVAHYSGDGTHAASTGSATVNIAFISSEKGSFALSAAPGTLTVVSGSQGSEAITVTPSGGYTGEVILNFTTSNDSALQNLCYNFSSANTSGAGTVVVSNGHTPYPTTQLIFDTNASDCANFAQRPGGMKPLHSLHPVRSASSKGNSSLPGGLALAGLLLAGLLGRSSRKLRGLACAIALAALGLGISACGGGGGTSTIANPPSGTYTITLTGNDSVNPSFPSPNPTTSFTLTIQ